MDLWKRPDIFDKGLDKALTPSDAGATPIVQPTPTGGLGRSPVSASVKSEDIKSGDLSVPLWSGKRNPKDTANGFWMGWDRDHVFKWTLGSPFAQADFGVTSPGVFYINLPRSGAASNAIFINDGSDDNNGAVDIRRFNGTGVGMGITSSAGYALLLTQQSNTPALKATSSVLTGGEGGLIYSDMLKGTSGAGFYTNVKGTGTGFKAEVAATAGDFSNPFVAIQNRAFNTNYYKVLNENGGGVIDIQHWIANNASPDTILTGEIGDWCISTNGKAYICQGGTSWLEFQTGADAPTNRFTFCTDFAASTRYTYDSSGASTTFDERGVTLANSGSPGREVVKVNLGGGPIYAGNPVFSFTLTAPSCTSGTAKSIYAGLGDVSDGTDVADYTKRHVGIKLVPTADNTFNVYGTQGDGTTEAASAAICSATNSDYIEVYVETASDASATYDVRLSGTAQTKTTVSGNMPASASFSAPEYMTVAIFSND